MALPVLPVRGGGGADIFWSYLIRTLSLTWSGVDLFFVLSGFLIVGILLDHRGATNYFQVFYFRRVCRIFPLYFLILLVFVCLTATELSGDPRFEWLFAHPFPIWSYATFTQNIPMAFRGDYGPNWLGMTWSLAFEEQFYLLIPFLVYILPRSVLLYLFIITVFAIPLFYAVFPDIPRLLYHGMPLLFGAGLAIIVRRDRFLDIARQHRRFLFAMFFTLLAGTALMTINYSLFVPFNRPWLAGMYSIFLLLSLIDENGVLSRILKQPLLVWFGTISYGIYMFHQAVSGLLYGLLRSRAPIIENLSDAAVTGLAFLITVLLSAVSYRFFEQPILKFGHRFRYAFKD